MRTTSSADEFVDNGISIPRVVNMSALSIVRIVVLSLSLFFGIAVLSLSSHLTFESTNVLFASQVPAFEAVGIAVGAITIVSLPVLLIVGLLRRGAFTSMIVFELSFLGFLCVLWLANAALDTDAAAFNFPLGCASYTPFYQGLCSELSAMQGLSFVTWLLLMGYNTTLLIFVLVAASRGNKVWNLSVAEANFFQRNGGMAIEQPPKVEPVNTAYQYPPAQYPQAQVVPAPYNPNSGFAPSRNNGYPPVPQV
ncbi:hypothetical protein HGRIS_004421 [Hohenbuehelia grisea]|uniref:MARVEL domain-containing protein n=1 Tax=Hohenbuehelia grisea TaxID=104357 RepID=A0ABR3JCJ7_9AGAR